MRAPSGKKGSASQRSVSWFDPTDKRSAGFVKQACKQIELTGKSIMASNATPADWWDPCFNQAGEIRNHVPLTKNIVSGDGDAKTPIEELSWGREAGLRPMDKK